MIMQFLCRPDNHPPKADTLLYNGQTCLLMHLYQYIAPLPSLGLQWGYSRGFDTKTSPHHGAFDKQRLPTIRNLKKKIA